MRALEGWLAAGLILWVVGVQSAEALASVGVAVCFLGVAAHALALRRDEAERLPEGAVDAAAELLRRFAARWLPLTLLVAWAIAAPTITAGWPTGTGLARLTDWLAIPVAAKALSLLGSRWRARVAICGGAVFGLSCVLAAFQHFGLWPRPEAFDALAWTRLPFYRLYETVPGSEGRYMAGGLLSHRLKFAHVGGLMVLLGLWLGLETRGKSRIAWLSLCALGFISVLVFPVARMAAAALAVAAAFSLARIPGRRRAGLLLGTGLLMAAIAVIGLHPPLRARLISSLSGEGSGDRGEILACGLRAVKERPLLGVGLGQFRPARFPGPSTPQHVLDNPGKAHNQLLSIAAEIGVPGLLLFLWLLAALAWRMRGLPLGSFGQSALLLFLLLALAHDPLFQAQFSMALALALGAALAIPSPARGRGLG
ncbi:MAG: O-antigen ligase family protein [Myxococcales bacterium]|nr:O-antigen ligase family protein [Myxococcales bacterium]